MLPKAEGEAVGGRAGFPEVDKHVHSREIPDLRNPYPIDWGAYKLFLNSFLSRKTVCYNYHNHGLCDLSLLKRELHQ